MKRLTLVHQFLEESSGYRPDKKAVFAQGQWVTYQEVEARANQVANYLREVGVGKHERITIILENSIDFIISFFAVLKVGAIAVPLPADIKARELSYILGNSDSTAAITRRSYLKGVLPAILESPSLAHMILDDIPDDCQSRSRTMTVGYLNKIFSSGDERYRRDDIIDVDLAEIVYTSGSTGRPKGVMLTHLNLVSNAHSIVEYLRIEDRDRIMCILPFSYIYGQSLLLTHFLAAGSVVIDNRFLFPNEVLKTMTEQEVTGFAGVPSTFTVLMTRSAIRQLKFPCLRYVTQAGGAMAPELQKEVAKTIAPAELVIMYGATEAAPRLSYLDPKDLAAKLGSIGKAIPNVDLFVADGEGNALPHGNEGEIVARGSNIMKGYWRDPEATCQVLRDGLYFTGDLGVADEDGYLFVVGRTKEIIKVKGYRVSPKEIEERLLRISGICEAAVIGVEDPILGEAIKALVVLGDPGSLTLNDILVMANNDVPVYKQIKQLVVVDALPKNSSGKVIKGALRDLND